MSVRSQLAATSAVGPCAHADEAPSARCKRISRDASMLPLEPSLLRISLTRIRHSSSSESCIQKGSDSQISSAEIAASSTSAIEASSAARTSLRSSLYSASVPRQHP